MANNKTAASACAFAVALVVHADAAPSPPSRPPEFGAPIAPAPAAPAQAEPAPPSPTPRDNEALRTQVLASGHVNGEALPPIAGESGCGIEAPLRLEAIVLSDGAKVALSPPTVMRASLAAAVADWVRDDLAPGVAKGDRLAGIGGTGGYECRGRNRVFGAKLSEHAIGNALDLGALRTERGEVFLVASPGNTDEQRSFFALMKRTACLRFATVLGPGADAAHAFHLHVDLEARRNGMRLCEWNVPAEAAPAGAPAKQQASARAKP
jgi:hypothetical protein